MTFFWDPDFEEISLLLRLNFGQNYPPTTHISVFWAFLSKCAEKKTAGFQQSFFWLSDFENISLSLRLNFEQKYPPNGHNFAKFRVFWGPGTQIWPNFGEIWGPGTQIWQVFEFLEIFDIFHFWGV